MALACHSFTIHLVLAIIIVTVVVESIAYAVRLHYGVSVLQVKRRASPIFLQMNIGRWTGPVQLVMDLHLKSMARQCLHTCHYHFALTVAPQPAYVTVLPGSLSSESSGVWMRSGGYLLKAASYATAISSSNVAAL